MRWIKAVVSLLVEETCGDTVAPKAWNGTATANLGPNVKAFLRQISRARCQESPLSQQEKAVTERRDVVREK